MQLLNFVWNFLNSKKLELSFNCLSYSKFSLSFIIHGIKDCEATCISIARI